MLKTLIETSVSLCESDMIFKDILYLSEAKLLLREMNPSFSGYVTIDGNTVKCQGIISRGM